MLKAMVAGQPVENHNDMYCSPYDYYPADFYQQPQEMCPAHPHICALHGDYGPVTVPMVSTNSSPPIAMPVQVPPGHVVQQIVDESGTLRHVILSPQAMLPMPPPYGPGPGASSNQPPQPYFTPQGIPPSFHAPHYGNPLQPGVLGHVPPPAAAAQQGHSPPPHTFHKDERTHRQYIKLKKKLEQKQLRSDGFSLGSAQGTPPVSPRKDLMNGMRRGKDRGMNSVGTSEDGEESSSVQDEEEDFHVIIEMLSTVKPPQVTELNSRSALLQWSPPERLTDSGPEGKSPELEISESDLRYEVLLSDKGKEGKYKKIYSGTSLSCRIQDLRPGTEYSVCVIVSLEDLRGPPSIPTTFSTPPCEPEQPPPPKLISRSRTSLLLRWSPAGDNGSHITQYVLEYDEGKGNGFVEVYKNRGKQHSLLKLQPSTSYKFRLAAINEYGRGPNSDVVTFSTSGSPPNAPVSPVLKEASVSSLHLAWQKRPDDVGFSLQMDDMVSGHGFRPIYNGPDTHYKQEGLYRHTEYKFRLRAHNEEGNSRWSDEVCYRTLPARPATPSRPYVKGRIHTHAFKIKWEPPSDTGGASITTYTLELNGGRGFEKVYSGPELEHMCDRLMPGTTYQVRVSCSSAGGSSDYSEPCTVTTDAVCPSKCPAPRLHGKARATSLTLKWGYPEYDGGSPLTEFEVELSLKESKCTVYRGKETECVVSDLSPGQVYVFLVRAFNRVGPSPWSDPLEVLSGAAPPEVPMPPHVNCRSSHNVSVHWQEPPSNGATVTDYRLEMATSDCENDFSTIYQGLANSYDVKGLSPATPYYFRIQACNSAGWSAFSEPTLAVTPASSPSVVSLPRYTATPTSVWLTWQQPDCHGAEILHYNIDMGDRILTTPGPGLEHTVEGLQPETIYRIRIQAVNNVGPGPFSPVLRASTLPLPPAPPKLECVGTGHNYLKLKWGDGKNVDFTQYILEMENSWTKEFQSVYQGTSHSYKVNRLQELTSYRFRIAASNDAGQGDFSSVLECMTSRTPPPAVKAPKISEIQQRSCLVEWNSCRPIGTDLIIYQVQLARLRDQDYKQVYRGPDTKVLLNDLESGTDYCVRVCPVRQASSGDLPGPYSSPATFSTVAPEPVVSQTQKAASSQVTEKRQLTDQQWAMIILCGFSFFSVLVAVIMQQAIHWSKDHS